MSISTYNYSKVNSRCTIPSSPPPQPQWEKKSGPHLNDNSVTSTDHKKKTRNLTALFVCYLSTFCTTYLTSQSTCYPPTYKQYRPSLVWSYSVTRHVPSPTLQSDQRLQCCHSWQEKVHKCTNHSKMQRNTGTEVGGGREGWGRKQQTNEQKKSHLSSICCTLCGFMYMQSYNSCFV